MVGWIVMTAYVDPTYVYMINDVAGVVAANNFISLFNPVGSGVVFLGLQISVSTYATTVSATPTSLVSKRITAASGGTLISASTIPRFKTSLPDPKTVIRIGNPTVTVVGLGFAPISPIISTGTGVSSSSASPPGNFAFVCSEGEGVVATTAAGNVNQIWNISVVWQEIVR